MKHFLILLVSLLLSSCSVAYVTYGNVSILDDNGQVIRQYDNSQLDIELIGASRDTFRSYAVKEGGSLVFTDSSNVTHFISGGIIIVDSIQTETIRNNHLHREE